MNKAEYQEYISMCRKYANDKEFRRFLALHLMRYQIYITENKINGINLDINPFDKLISDLSEIQ